MVARIEALTAPQLSQFVAQRLALPPTLLTFGPEARVANTPSAEQLRELIDAELRR